MRRSSAGVEIADPGGAAAPEALAVGSDCTCRAAGAARPFPAAVALLFVLWPLARRRRRPDARRR